MPKYVDTRYRRNGYKDFIRKFCRLENGVQNVWNFCWELGNGYEGILAAEEDIEIVSASPDDTYDTGSHGQEVIIIGQGDDGFEKAYSIKLNGTTPVRLSAEDPTIKFNIIYRAFVISKSQDPTAGANNGAITISSVTTAKTMCYIKQNAGQSQIGLYRFPKDSTGEFLQYSLFPDANQPFVLDFKILDPEGSGFRTTGELDVPAISGTPTVTYPKPLFMGPGSTIMLFIKPEQNQTTATVQFFMEKKPIDNYDTLVEEGTL